MKMIINVYSIYDTKVKAYNQPFFSQNNGSALRSFEDAINKSGDNPLKAHAEDYVLFWLGKFDDEKGTFDVPKCPEAIGKAVEYLKG